MKRAALSLLLALLPSLAGAQGTGLSTGLEAFDIEVAQDSLYQGLVSYWKLSEASGTRSDSKGTNHLTSNNSVAQVAGQLGNAAGFTAASSQWLNVSAGTVSTGAAMSLSFWLYMNDTGNIYGILNKDIYSSNRSWIIESNSSAPGDSKFYFALNTTDVGVHYGVTAGLVIPATTWTHIVWVFDGSQSSNATRLVCYVNGVAKTLTFAGSSVPSSLPAGTADIEFGRRSNGVGRYLPGRIDDTGLWSRALTAAEVTRLYGGGSGYALY